MKKATLILALIMVFSLCSVPAYATENTTIATVKSTDNGEVVPYGVLSGYGNKWHEPSADRYGGSFSFRVSGMNWVSAQLTIKLENFNPSTKMNIEVYQGNNCIFRRNNVGINDGPWENVTFSPGLTGVYDVVYKIVGGPNTPGRINCWIY